MTHAARPPDTEVTAGIRDLLHVFMDWCDGGPLDQDAIRGIEEFLASDQLRAFIESKDSGQSSVPTPADAFTRRHANDCLFAQDVGPCTCEPS